MSWRAGILYRVALTGGVSLAAAMGMFAASAVPAAAAKNVNVYMHEFQFCPEHQCPGTMAGNVGIVTINPGDSVTWVWDESSGDLAPNCDSTVLVLLQNGFGSGCPGHTVTKQGQPFHTSCPITTGSPGCPYTYTFNYSGTYDYFCAYHGGRTQGNKPLTEVVPNMDGRVIVNRAGSNSPPPTNVNAGSGDPLPNSTTARDDLPNTFIPGLPNAGLKPQIPAFLLLGPLAVMAVAAALAGTLRLFSRR